MADSYTVAFESKLADILTLPVDAGELETTTELALLVPAPFVVEREV